MHIPLFIYIDINCDCSLLTSLMAIMRHLGSEDHCVGGEEDSEAEQHESGPDHGGR